MQSPFSILLSTIRWLARATGTALAVMIIIFAAADGPPNPFAQPLPVRIELFAMLAMLIGMLIGWRWEMLAGFVILCGLGVLNIVELTVNHRFAGRAFPLFAIPGLLYLASALLRKTRTQAPRELSAAGGSA